MLVLTARRHFCRPFDMGEGVKKAARKNIKSLRGGGGLEDSTSSPAAKKHAHTISSGAKGGGRAAGPVHDSVSSQRIRNQASVQGTSRRLQRG